MKHPSALLLSIKFHAARWIDHLAESIGVDAPHADPARDARKFRDWILDRWVTDIRAKERGIRRLSAKLRLATATINSQDAEIVRLTKIAELAKVVANARALDMIGGIASTDQRKTWNELAKLLNAPTSTVAIGAPDSEIVRAVTEVGPDSGALQT